MVSVRQEPREGILLIEFLSIAVPVFYLAPRYLLKGTSAQEYVEAVGEILAAFLLVMALLKVVFKWQDLEVRHLVLARKNADIAYEASQIIGRTETVEQAVIDQFMKRASDVDQEDGSFLVIH